jgi:hypothetical protein
MRKRKRKQQGAGENCKIKNCMVFYSPNELYGNLVNFVYPL